MPPLFLGVIVVASIVIWTTVLFAEVCERRVTGNSARAIATVTLYGLTPLGLWLAGTHHPLSDFARLPPVTFEQKMVSRVAQLALLGLLVSVGLDLVSRRVRAGPWGQPLWLGYLAFSAGSFVAMLAGTHPWFRFPVLFAPVGITLIYLYIRLSADLLMRLFRRALLAYVWGSLALEILNQAWAFSTQSRLTLLLGFSRRLFGVAADPNSLGAAAGTALLLVVAGSRGRWRLINAIAAGLVLAQTDARMAIAGTAAALVVLFTHNRERGRHLRTALAVIVVALPLAGILGSNSSPEEWIAKVTDGGVSTSQVSTLNGRTDVWEATLAEWRKNRAFGYGPSIWSPEYRRQFGDRFVWVGHAHNQWIQTLGDSGVVGFTGLVLYMVVMIIIALRTSVRSKGLTLALVILLLFRMLAESALRSPGFDLTTALHLATFTALIAFSQPEELSPSVGDTAGQASEGIVQPRPTH